VARPRTRGRGGGDADTTTSRPRRPRGGSGARSVAHAQDTTHTEIQQGRPPGASKPQLLLPAPNPTTLTLSQIRNIRNRQERAAAMEQHSREQYGGGAERHYPVATNTDPNFPVTTPGGRKVDNPVDLPGGRTLAVEVKFYQEYRTISLPEGTRVTEKVEVPLSADIRQQIAKDVALRRADPNFDPRWVFYGAGPNPQLRQQLTDAGIVFVEHHRPTRGSR
jgi:hypothetical protein